MLAISSCGGALKNLGKGFIADFVRDQALTSRDRALVGHMPHKEIRLHGPAMESFLLHVSDS
jgi:hypothetical protein